MYAGRSFSQSLELLNNTFYHHIVHLQFGLKKGYGNIFKAQRAFFHLFFISKVIQLKGCLILKTNWNNGYLRLIKETGLDCFPFIPFHNIYLLEFR